MARTDMDSSLNYINNTVNRVYEKLYDVCKEMSKDELLQLIDGLLVQQMKKENELLNHIYDTGNTELATNYAHTTQSYIRGIDSSVDEILFRRNQENKIEASENSLPGNIIL